MSAENEEYTSDYEGVTAISSLIVGPLALALTIFHASKIYSDLYTPQRSVLDFRRSKPKISPGYKRLTYLTLTAICSYALAASFGCIQYNFTQGHCTHMFALQLFDKFFFYLGKCALYLVLIIRLHEVYGKSAYGYNYKKLYCLGITVIICCSLFFIFVQVFTVQHPLYYDDTDKVFPFFCQVVIQEEYMMILGAFVGLFDLAACILSIIAFIIPLNKVINACNTDSNNNKRYAKMLYTGYKYKVLVFVSAMSTLLWILLYTVGLHAIATVFAYADGLINPICLMLMTPYYPADVYYEKLCFICICCCDPKRKSYRSNASDTHAKPVTSDVDSTVVTDKTGISVDTDMALGAKLESYPGTKNENYESNLAAVQENNTVNAKEITPAPPDDGVQENADDDANL